MTKLLQDREKRAIALLRKAAKIWPESLVLVHHGDGFGLKVKRTADCPNDRAEAAPLVQIDIPTEAVA